jgi:predicted NACHT family NTPase
MNVMQFIVTQFDICNFPDAQPFVEQLLKAGKAIVLLDGLDEVQQADNKQDAVVMDIKDFVNKYDTSQYLITCRIAATDFTFEQFTYVEMADFTPSQVQTFVAKWFGESTDRGQAFLEEFQRPDHEGLREMAQTPLLLTLLCLTFEETLSFPQRRVEIYEEAIDALLKKWDSSRNIRRDDIYHKLSLGRKRQMLARIAAATFEEGQYFIPQQVLIRQIEDYLRRLPPADADEDIDGEAVLKAIEAQHGIFVERARRIYSFAHLTFQEYFTARYIADNAAGGTLARLVNDHLTNPRWREVFLLVASMLDDADDLFGLMIERVNDFAASSDVLMTTLQLVEDRVKTIQAYPDAVLVRASALAQALDTTKDINDNINLALDLEFALVLAVDHAHTFPMDLVENNHMARYLIAMQLIVDCLELAYVANRAAIEGRLLLPPQQPSS